MANSKGGAHKIPDKYREPLYEMYASGKLVSEIHRHVVEDLQIDCSQRTVAYLLREIRMEKLAAFRERLEAETIDDMNGLESLKQKLEVFAQDNINDKRMFLKSCELIMNIYKFKLEMARVTGPNTPFYLSEDNGKQKLIDELSKIN